MLFSIPCYMLDSSMRERRVCEAFGKVHNSLELPRCSFTLKVEAKLNSQSTQNAELDCEKFKQEDEPLCVKVDSDLPCKSGLEAAHVAVHGAASKERHRTFR